MAEFTLEDFGKAHEPARATARVGFRRDLFDRHAQLEAELVKACQDPTLESSAEPISAQILALQDEMVAAEHEFTFKSIGRRAWVKLLAEHPPRPDDKTDHNPETFPPAALAASAVEPTLSVETAAEMMGELNLGQWDRLWNACLTANIGGGDGPKSAVATAVARLYEQSLTTADLAASPSASS